MKRKLAAAASVLLFMLTACGVPLAGKGHLLKPDRALQHKQLKEASEEKIPPAATVNLDVPLINQMDHPRLYNGCEVSSMAMIFNYHGIDITKNELADKVKRVPLTYDNGLKGNPHDGFVGDMENGPGLAIFHEPMHQLAESYFGERAVDISGAPVEELYRYLAEGLPIWIITTTNLVPVNNFETWETPTGKIDVSFNVHSVAVTGYDKNAVYVNNPYGQKNQKVNKKDFEEAWKQMGSQAIVITK